MIRIPQWYVYLYSNGKYRKRKGKLLSRKWTDLQMKGTQKLNWYVLTITAVHNFIFQLDDHRLILRNILHVSPPSMCSILKSGSSGTLQHCGRKEGARRKESDSNVAESWMGSEEASTSLESSSLPLPQRGIRHAKQRVPTTPAAGTTALTTKSGSFLLPLLLPTAVLKSAGRTSSEDAANRERQKLIVFIKIRPQSSSLENKIMHNTDHESLNQFINHRCLSQSEDSIFLVRVSSFLSYFCVLTLALSLSTWSVYCNGISLIKGKCGKVN